MKADRVVRDPVPAPEADPETPLPVASPAAASPSSQASWPPQALALAEQLQRSLVIGDRDWHALKSQRARRGAEQIAAALVLLLARDQPAQRQPTEARQEAIALLEHALGWLKAELSDPGCPSHGR
ncbi:MAG: DUF6439 family protein [Cyanobium sp.]